VVLRDAALAHRQADPAAHCSDDIVAALRQPGACLAAHRDEIGREHHQALPDAPDSVAKLKVPQQDAGLRELFPQDVLLQDVLLQARFPVQRQAAAARRVAAQMEQAQLRDVERQSKQEPLVQLQQASQA
jgi:hypothetical protein